MDVDLSPISIEKARQLGRQAGLNARYVCSDVCQFQCGSQPPVDIAFSSYGAICWLPDLTRWADIVASSRTTGEVFYLAEFHSVHELVTGYHYFDTDKPDIVKLTNIICRQHPGPGWPSWPPRRA